jgi:hypothetical protein
MYSNCCLNGRYDLKRWHQRLEHIEEAVVPVRYAYICTASSMEGRIS